MSDFAGRLVLVTGAGGGIGAAIAGAFAGAGATVLLADLDGDAARSQADLLVARGLAAHGLTRDVADRAAGHALRDRVEREHGDLSVLVNNAGINRRVPADADTAEADWDAVLAVNVTGPFTLARAFLPALARTGGTIVNLASIQSFIAFPNSIAYTASKGAVAQMTKAMAVEFAPRGIRVNAVAPGFTATAMTEPTRANPDRMEALARRIPLARFATPEEIAGPVLFLASKAAGYVTGAILPVDGGVLAT